MEREAARKTRHHQVSPEYVPGRGRATQMMPWRKNEGLDTGDARSGDVYLAWLTFLSLALPVYDRPSLHTTVAVQGLSLLSHELEVARRF